MRLKASSSPENGPNKLLTTLLVGPSSVIQQRRALRVCLSFSGRRGLEEEKPGQDALRLKITINPTGSDLT